MCAKKRNKKAARSVKQKSSGINALCVDTSNGEIGLSVVKDGRCSLEDYHAAEGAYNRDVLAVIEKALKKTAMQIRDFDVFASVLGPGSFTGVRVGVAAMKAFAQAAGKPFYGLSALDVLAETAAASGKKAVCPAIDARRGEVFTASYSAGAKGAKRVTDYVIMKTEDFLASASRKKCLPVISATDEKLSAIIENSGAQHFMAAHIDMKVFGNMVATGFRDNDPGTVYTVMPDYIRKPDAVVNMEKKQNEASNG